MKVYKILISDSSWGKIDFMENQEGAIRIPLEEDSNLSIDIISNREFCPPDIVYFATDFDLVPTFDIIKNNIGYLFSKRIIKILKEIGEFANRTFKTVLFDHKELEAYHIEEGLLFSEIKSSDNNYCLIQLMNYTEAFDYENSEYRMKKSFPNKVGSIRKMVLKTPASGFPTIFKIKEKKSAIFVTEEAKNALEAAGIKGCVFEEVEVSS